MASVLIKKSCPFCYRHQQLWFDADKYQKWKAGEGNVQDIFPECTPDEREFLITGICSECWERLNSMSEGD